ncbi:MAG: acyl-CoA dehydrogenase [Dehalococcoidia bacterium]|nr:acyl-CoA dehydrogenase [Dehalococcoidia bacterium]
MGARPAPWVPGGRKPLGPAGAARRGECARPRLPGRAAAARRRSRLSSPSSERQRQLIELAGSLADEFAGRAERYDRENSFPFENFDRLRELRYTSLTVPERYGGLGANLLEFCRAQERLAKGDGATALGVNMHLFGIGSLAERGDLAGEAADRFFRPIVGGVIMGGGFSEPESGQNWASPSSVAVRTPGGYVLNGRKTFNSLAPIVGLFFVTARIEDPADREPHVGFFVVLRGTPGLEIKETWDTMGMRATQSHDLLITDARVAEQQLFSKWPTARRSPQFSNMGVWFQLSVASVYIGIAAAALDYAVTFANQRRPAALANTIAHFPATQFTAAEMLIELEASRALVRGAASDWLTRPEPASEAEMAQEASQWLVRSSIAKTFATDAAVRIVDRALEITGGVGLFRRFPLERYYRDVRAGKVHPVSRALSLELIGKQTLGVPLDIEPRWG